MSWAWLAGVLARFTGALGRLDRVDAWDNLWLGLIV
jgi:hypothetical protein